MEAFSKDHVCDDKSFGHNDTHIPEEKEDVGPLGGLKRTKGTKEAKETKGMKETKGDRKEKGEAEEKGEKGCVCVCV